MKVVIRTPTDPGPVHEALTRLDGCNPIVVRSSDELLAEMPGATGLVIGSYLYRDVFQQLADVSADLRWIQLSASGYEIYQELGAPEGVTVMRAVGVWGRSVAGHALALTLGLMRKLPEIERARAQRRWVRNELQPRLQSLAGRKVLLVGYGDIGGIIAATLRILGADVTIVARRARSASPDGPIASVDDLDSFLADTEIAILAVPSHQTTTGLFSRERLSRLKKGALVINVGRGEVVDEDALADLLQNGHLGGAGLDVYRVEPLPQDSALWECPNVILSPHTAAFGDDQSLERLGALAVENAMLIAAGKTPRGFVGVGSQRAE